MASQIYEELLTKYQQAWQEFTAQLDGLEGYLDQRPLAQEWTVREILSHLIGRPEGGLKATISRMAQEELPELDMNPGQINMTPERQGASLDSLLRQLEVVYKKNLEFAATLSDEVWQRKGHFPGLGGSEFTALQFAKIGLYGHLRDHAGQLAKIRAALQVRS